MADTGHWSGLTREVRCGLADKLAEEVIGDVDRHDVSARVVSAYGDTCRPPGDPRKEAMERYVGRLIDDIPLEYLRDELASLAMDNADAAEDG